MMGATRIANLIDLRDALKRLNLLANRGRFPLDEYVQKEREVEALVKEIMKKTEELERVATEIIGARGA
jgi:hypothetical protein